MSGGVTVDGTRMRAIRRSRGLSLHALAARAGVSYPVVNRMEHSGRHGGCTPFSLAAVAAALTVDPSELLPRPDRVLPGGPPGDVDCPTCGAPLKLAAR